MKQYLIALVAAAVVAVPSAVHAQSTMKSMSMDSGMMKHQHADSGAHAAMMAKLNLTVTQKGQVKAIHEKYGAQMKTAHGAGQSSMAGMSGMGNMKGMSMPGMEKMEAQEIAEVRAVLTPEQQTQFDKLMADHMKHDAIDHSKMKMPMGSTPRM